MMLSYYNICVRNSTHALVFNTKSGAILVTSIQKWEEISRMSFNDDEKKALVELGLIVHSDEDEFARIQNKCVDKIKDSHLKKYRILTTTGCNAKCWYCYEKGIDHFSMSEATALDVAKFVVENASDGDTIHIEWFGGEPLLNTNAIDVISRYVKQHVSPNIFFKSSVISNASCINEEIINKMQNEWSLKRIQITIDGIGSKYEEVKKLGIGSFEKLIRNINKLIEANIKVDIRLNFDDSNIEDIKEITSFFESYRYRDKITVYAAKIFSEKSKCGYFDLEQATIAVDDILHSAKLKLGLNMIPRVFKTSCMATYPGFYTIDPQGRLFKCDRRLLDKNSKATVRDWKGKIQDLSIWEELNVAEKCKKCNLYPLCWGGCVYDRLNKIYPCYLSKRIVEHCLELALEDILPECTSKINVFLRQKPPVS